MALQKKEDKGMSNTVLAVLGAVIPLVGTTLGAAMVFFLKGEMKPKLQKALLGFASGVMIAASVWSLLIPSIEMAEASGGMAWLPAAVGFLAGMGFLLLLDTLIPHMHMDSDCPEGCHCGLGKSKMLVLAGMLSGSALISTAGAFALAIGIAIQNFPEGAIISMPLVGTGLTRKRAFAYGFLSGVVEPVGALLTVLLTSLIQPVLPFILAFAAGAMIYVVIEELIPESQAGDHSNIGTIGAALGFALMMVLDVALG